MAKTSSVDELDRAGHNACRTLRRRSLPWLTADRICVSCMARLPGCMLRARRPPVDWLLHRQQGFGRARQITGMAAG
eukprot:2163128-Pleurochrysis_carterae.AAC.5